MSREKDDLIKTKWLAVQAELNPGETEEDRMNTNISLLDAGLHRVKNDKGLWAYFPSVPAYPSNSQAQRDLEDEWQAKNMAMHLAQEPLPPPVPRGAEEPTGEGGFMFHRVVADESPRSIQKFHESPGSTERQRAVTDVACSCIKVNRYGF